MEVDSGPSQFQSAQTAKTTADISMVKGKSRPLPRGSSRRGTFLDDEKSVFDFA